MALLPPWEILEEPASSGCGHWAAVLVAYTWVLGRLCQSWDRSRVFSSFLCLCSPCAWTPVTQSHRQGREPDCRLPWGAQQGPAATPGFHLLPRVSSCHQEVTWEENYGPPVHPKAIPGPGEWNWRGSYGLVVKVRIPEWGRLGSDPNSDNDSLCVLEQVLHRFPHV